MEMDAGMLLVDVAGVGYEVEVSAGVLQGLPRTGEELTLHTHFVVREDAQLLYGFVSKAERELFRAFIKINGVGPKLGLALISALDLQSLSAAVRNNDVSLLTKVPGVGKKTAERLMVELKNRLEDLSDSSGVALNVVSVAGADGVISPGVAVEAEDALLALGYRPQEASRAVAHALANAGDTELSAEELVRLALRGFAKASSAS
jgi:Holliday junction DNA helicase RuvA